MNLSPRAYLRQARAHPTRSGLFRLICDVILLTLEADTVSQ